MISPVQRPISRYAVVDRNDQIKYYTLSEADLLSLPKECFHRGVAVFVETFGGKIVLQKFNGKVTMGSFGHVLAYEPRDSAASRVVKNTLGVRVDQTEFEKVATVSPCEESGGEFIYVFNILIDLKKEKIEPGKHVSEIIVAPLNVVVDDAFDNRSVYSPIFIILLNMFLELYKC